MSKRGFTLVELMVSILIIAILVSISVPLYLNHQEKSIAGKALSNLERMYSAQLVYNVDYGGFDTDEPSLQGFMDFSLDDGDWTYTVTNVAGDTFTVEATRSRGRFSGQTISMTLDNSTRQKQINYPGGGSGWPP